jgi:phosphoribosylglycinamide formyltransferase-1
MNRTLMILVSGEGTTLEWLASRTQQEKVNARISCVLSNKANIRAADVANRYNLDYWVLNPKIYPPQENWNEVFHDLVKVYRPGLIVLAGFDKLVSIPPNYHERVVNIHPSLLPKFGGKGMFGDKVHEAVLDAEEEMTGCTVHVCTEELDKGTILASTRVPVERDDTVETLRKRVQKAERECLPDTIEHYLDVLEGRNIY